MANGTQIIGRAQMAGTLVRAAVRFPAQVGAAAFAELEIEMAESKTLVPLDDGPLRASGFVEPPVFRGREIEVTLGYGGPAAPYAIEQHENLDYEHAPGRQAKYLEQPLRESAPHLMGRIGRRVQFGSFVN